MNGQGLSRTVGRMASALVALCLLSGLAAAAPPELDVQVGFNNVCKVGHWTPVRVRVTAADTDLNGRLELSTVDGDGVDCLFVDNDSKDLEIPAGQTKTVLRYVRMGRTRGRLQARLSSGDVEVASQRVAFGRELISLYSTQRWVLVIGGPVDLDSLVARHRSKTLYALQVTNVDDTQQLPDHWFGYEGVDTIILTTARDELVQKLTAAQLNALEHWTRMGGTLLLSIGANGKQLAGEGGPLRRFLRSPIEDTEQISEAPGLETFARAETPLPGFTLSKFQAAGGDVATYVEARAQGERPAIVRSAYSFGKTILFGFDLEAAPWNEWQHTPSIIESLLLLESDATEQQSENQAVHRIGYDEMSGQLRGALDHFAGNKERPGVTVITFWTVFPLLLIYIALVGPGDFFLLQRLLKRMEWTWITFPILIIATSVTVYLVGRYWRGGNSLRVNQVDLVDVDPLNGFMRGTTWAHLYNPTSAVYDLQLQPEPAIDITAPATLGSLLSWQGLPGVGLGGFDTTTVDLFSSAPYRSVAENGATATGQEIEIEDLLLPTATTKGFLGRWWRIQSFAPPPKLTVDHNGVLHGLVQNNLSVPLSDALIAHDQWVYRLDRTLNPGESMAVDALMRRDLEWRLTRRRVLQSTTEYSSTPWNPQDREIQRIMEIMMFYEAAGGHDYTGLTQQYQGFVDLSEQLRLGHAVLVGRSRNSAVHLHRAGDSLTDEAEQKWTWYRFVLPVDRSKAPPPELDEESFEGTLN